jgi:hypothetical protein
MGALPVGTCGDRLRANAAGLFEILGECRQSGALFAARPSRSAETRPTALRASLLDAQEPRSEFNPVGLAAVSLRIWPDTSFGVTPADEYDVAVANKIITLYASGEPDDGPGLTPTGRI